MLPDSDTPARGSALRERGLPSSLETIVRALARQAAMECFRQACGEASGLVDVQAEEDTEAAGRAAALGALLD